MDLVVDANVFFLILIKNGKTEDLRFEPELHLFAPEFIFEEFEKYKAEILGKTERSEEELDEILEILKRRINIIPNEKTDKYLQEAKEICPDQNDIDCFTLALKLKYSIWPNDKELKKQKIIKVYSREEVMNL